MSYLVEDLIESVKERSFAPISQTTFEDANIVRILNDELSIKLAAQILTAREDFFLSRATIPLVAGKDRYPIPKRAIGNALKVLFLVDSNGNKQSLMRRDIDRLDEYSSGTGTSAEFYFEGDEIVLMQAPSDSSNSLLVSYPRRPSRLALTSTCAKVTSISSSSTHTTFTVDTDLSASLAVDSDIDVLSHNSPFLLWAEEIAITAITTTTIEVLKTDVVDAASSVEPVVGDYICPYGTANIAQIPIEFHPVLAEMAACRMLRSLGDMAKWQAAKAELKEMLSDALNTIKNRAESSPERPSVKRGLIRNFRG